MAIYFPTKEKYSISIGKDSAIIHLVLLLEINYIFLPDYKLTPIVYITTKNFFFTSILVLE